LNFREMIDSWKRIIRLARKPTYEEYMVSLKMSLLGLTLVGSIAFIIRLVFVSLYTGLYGG
jgi:protein transport protein SEC61 subunit gamma-like protein